MIIKKKHPLSWVLLSSVCRSLFTIIVRKVASSTWNNFVSSVGFKRACIHIDCRKQVWLMFACCYAIFCFVDDYCPIWQLFCNTCPIGVKSSTIHTDVHIERVTTIVRTIHESDTYIIICHNLNNLEGYCFFLITTIY